jgi:hypothetical protein
MSLPVSNLVNVSVSLTPNGAAALSFGVLMIAGDSPVINGTQRFRSYSDITSVASDFGTTAPEYLAASLFFSQSPQPSTCMIGRWFSSAAAAQNDGGILSASQQTLANFTSISSGGFIISIDGTAHTLTGLNFTGCTNLNAVASTITAALPSGVVCTWNGTNFVITSGTTGIGTNASGTVTFASNPSSGDTLTLNTQALTFETTVSGANQILLGSTATATAANLQAFLMASTNALFTVASYSTSANVLSVTYNTVGTTGNAYALATSNSSAMTLSHATLQNGAPPSSVGYATSPLTGTDISSLLQLTSALSQALVPGFAAESPAACASALTLISPAWYGLMFAATATITNDQMLAVSALIESQPIKRVLGVTTQESGVLSSLITNDFASRAQAAGYNRTCTQYSSTNPYAIASFMGRAFSVDYTSQNTTITLMFKQEPGVTAENLSTAQAATLKAKNCNVFVNYVNNTMIIQYGVMASGQYFDVIQGTDWLQNAIQTNVYNVLYTTTTKIPQTDAGVNQITNAIGQSCGQGVTNGLVAPGIWNGPSFGEIVTGQFLKAGYYVYAQPIALQSQASRSARACPPIQVAVKLAGAIQSVSILVDVNS